MKYAGLLTLLAMTLAGCANAEPYHACRECEVRLNATVALRTDSTFQSSRMLSIAKLADGGYAVSHLFGAPQILVYDRAGTLQRAVSVQPDLENAPRLIVQGDTLLAFGASRAILFDRKLQRVGVLQFPVRPRLHAAVLRDGRIALEAAGPIPVVRLVDRAGGASEPVPEPAAVRGSAVLLQPEGYGFIQLRSNTSRLELRRADGSLVRAVTIGSPWFREWQEPMLAREGTARPNALRAAMGRFSDRDVLLVSHVPRPDWEGPSGGVFFDYDANAQWSSIIEIVSLDTGEVLAGGHTTGAFEIVQGAPDELFWVHMQDEGGVAAEIVKVKVIERGRDS